MRRRPNLGSSKGKEPARRTAATTARARMQELEARLAEAQEQLAATGEILRVIASSPSAVAPVFDAVLASAGRLCAANDLAVLRVVGDELRVAAAQGPWMASLPGDLGIPLTRGSVATRAVVDRASIHVHDLPAEPADEYPIGRDLARRFGHRTMLAVPLLREGVPIGVICAFRFEVRPFSPQQIALLETFAAQAVIAIDNVRLFNELQQRNQAVTRAHAKVTEALEQQTATAEILRAISGSPTDAQPVFDAIVRSAVRLCNGSFSIVGRFDGALVDVVANANFSSEALSVYRQWFPRRPADDRILEQVILQHRVVNVGDVTERFRHVPGQREDGFRSVLFVPMLRGGASIGLIGVSRLEVGAFPEDQVELLKTFAEQAVIAIENVRLFNDLREKNGALTEALEQQTATAEILRVISSSPTELQPVFDTIVRNAVNLCDATFGGLQRIAGDRMTLDAQYGVPPDELAVLQRDVFPLPISRESATGRAVLDRAIAHIPDIREDPGFRTPRLPTMRRYRTILAVPMMREGIPIGALALWRSEVRRFSDAEVALVQTFADQAVIAIENVRLLRELQTRTEELSRSVEQLTALAEVGQAISSTLDLQTVLTRIAARATQLAGVDAGAIYEYDESREIFEPRATHQLEPEIVRALEASPVRKGEGATGRLAEVRAPIQVADFQAATVPGGGSARNALLRAGYRGLLAVPLVREERLIGGLTVFRKAPGEYSPDVVEVLRTFASQSALAIQNARLFRELEQKSRELEAASRHKSEFLANMSHELRTPLNAVIGFSEVLTERMFGDLNEKQDEYLRDIYASGQHLLSLINDILDLSKIEAGRMELELTDFDLPSAIDNALILVRERAGRRGIALAQSIGERVSGIRADERKVKQVLLNLLSNALKFTPEGGRVEVAAAVRDTVVEVSVADTGVGIAPEDQEAVFEEFRQVGTASKKVEGTGLGLALSRKFIELHGGRIWVRSELGHGATFTFSLPLSRES